MRYDILRNDTQHTWLVFVHDDDYPIIRQWVLVPMEQVPEEATAFVCGVFALTDGKRCCRV